MLILGVSNCYMKIKHTHQHLKENNDHRINHVYAVFDRMITVLNGYELKDEVVEKINAEVNRVNQFDYPSKKLKKQVNISKERILRLVSKHHGLVPKNHYRNIWLKAGIAVFGIPIGIGFGTAFGNMGFIGLGIPVGLGLGTGLGVFLDEYASRTGRQIDFEI